MWKWLILSLVLIVVGLVLTVGSVRAPHTPVAPDTAPLQDQLNHLRLVATTAQPAFSDADRQWVRDHIATAAAAIEATKASIQDVQTKLVGERSDFIERIEAMEAQLEKLEATMIELDATAVRPPTDAPQPAPRMSAAVDRAKVDSRASLEAVRHLRVFPPDSLRVAPELLATEALPKVVVAQTQLSELDDMLAVLSAGRGQSDKDLETALDEIQGEIDKLKTDRQAPVRARLDLAGIVGLFTTLCGVSTTIVGWRKGSLEMYKLRLEIERLRQAGNQRDQTP